MTEILLACSGNWSPPFPSPRELANSLPFRLGLPKRTVPLGRICLPHDDVRQAERLAYLGADTFSFRVRLLKQTPMLGRYLLSAVSLALRAGVWTRVQ